MILYGLYFENWEKVYNFEKTKKTRDMNPFLKKLLIGVLIIAAAAVYAVWDGNREENARIEAQNRERQLEKEEAARAEARRIRENMDAFRERGEDPEKWPADIYDPSNEASIRAIEMKKSRLEGDWADAVNAIKIAKSLKNEELLKEARKITAYLTKVKKKYAYNEKRGCDAYQGAFARMLNKKLGKYGFRCKSEGDRMWFIHPREIVLHDGWMNEILEQYGSDAALYLRYTVFVFATSENNVVWEASVSNML